MLLPNFRFAPDGDIQLGTLLTRNSETKRPDPNRPIHRITKLQIPDTDIRSQESQPFSWNSDDHVSKKLGLFAELSLFTGIGGDLGGSQGGGLGLKIESDCICTTWFNPSSSYISQTLEDDKIKPYTRKWIKPPLYMVTGLIVSENTRLETANSKERGFEASLAIDATTLHVPLKAGPKAGYDRTRSTNKVEHITAPTILGYQLIRIRAKKNGTFETSGENKWAVFNDEDVEDQETSLKDHDIELVTPAMAWEDN